MLLFERTEVECGKGLFNLGQLFISLKNVSSKKINTTVMSGAINRAADQGLEDCNGFWVFEVNSC